MNALEAMNQRKSIRKYTGEMIAKEQLETILQAGISAPIGRGLYDTIQITVIQNTEFLQELDKASAVAFGNPDIHPLYGAPVLVLVSSLFTATTSENVACSNCACIVENMSLAAVELGVGSCHIWGAIRALNASPTLLEKLNLPENFKPCCGIILGQTDETYTAREIPMDKIQTVYFD